MKRIPVGSHCAVETVRSRRRVRGALEGNALIGVTTLSLVLIATGLAGCGGSGGLSVGVSAPGLPEFDETGDYHPYYATGEMNTPRYLHEIIRLADGLVLVVGGSDENGFSAIDSAELFDQGKLKSDEKAPESKTGTWFDTDFEGNPIVMSFPRLFHTLTQLPNDTVLVIGGAPTLTQSLPLKDAEVYDPLTRTFELLESEMIEPRFNHQATDIGDGKVMITGGQIHTVFTQSQQAIIVGGGQQQQQQVQIQLDIFPTTKVNELYSLQVDEFLPLNLPDSQRTAELTTSRGRSAHTVERFAGPDNRLNTGDDLFLLVGGYQSLSGENAPQQKFPGQVIANPGVCSGFGGHGAILSLEFYDPVVGVFTEVLVVRLDWARSYFPQAVNLGQHNEFTPDGVLGMGNCILVCCGDDNEPLGPRDTSWVGDEVYVATFTGFGPAQGLEFFQQDDPYGEHVQNIEYLTLEGLPKGLGRCETNVVPLPRRIVTTTGNPMSTWVYAGGGYELFCFMGGQILYADGTIRSGAVFDPFFSLTAVFDFDSSPRDLRPGRRNSGNPVGVIGTWLTLDGLIPTNSINGFSDSGFPADLGELRAGERAWTALVAVAGEDGVNNTIDDRVLLTGGGSDPFAPGGEPSFPSAEVWVAVGQGSDSD